MRAPFFFHYLVQKYFDSIGINIFLCQVNSFSTWITKSSGFRLELRFFTIRAGARFLSEPISPNAIEFLSISHNFSSVSSMIFRSGISSSTFLNSCYLLFNILTKIFNVLVYFCTYEITKVL